jgi:hypothetical protein
VATAAGEGEGHDRGRGRVAGALVVAPRSALPVQELVASVLWWLGASLVVFDARVR